MNLKIIVIILILINTVLTVSGQTFLKLGINKVQSLHPSSLANFFLNSFLTPEVVFGICLYSISMFMWLVILSKANLSFAYPVVAISYVLILISSVVFLHETVTPIRIIGVAVIILGVGLISQT